MSLKMGEGSMEKTESILKLFWKKKTENSDGRQSEKILVINTLENEICSDFEETERDIEYINVSMSNIKSCLGCNGCWLKTPGRCVIKDDYEAIFKKILKADKVIFITEERNGMVSYKLKNMIDRFIPVGLPYTCIKNGQARHAARYNKGWKFGIVVKGSNELEYIAQWLERVAINFHSESIGVFNITEKEKIQNAIYNS